MTDPTCGSGGLLLNCALQLKDAGRVYRTLKLYGQEIDLITSAIGCMNMFMHGIEEFQIVRGDTLSEPALLENDTLKTFNVILANPAYSIKAWDRTAFQNDPWDATSGVPPQGCADYAFQQHIQKSLDPKNGRYAILWPHRHPFRDAERSMRRQMIESDTVEAVVGLGGNLLYNSPMEAMVLVGNTNKPKRGRKSPLHRRSSECVQDTNNAYLNEDYIQRMFRAFEDYVDIPHFAAVVTNKELLENKASMNVHHYVKRQNTANSIAFSRVSTTGTRPASLWENP